MTPDFLSNISLFSYRKISFITIRILSRNLTLLAKLNITITCSLIEKNRTLNETINANTSVALSYCS